MKLLKHEKHALSVIARCLRAPRDRLGRLDMSANDETRKAREELRVLMVKHELPGGRDTIDQCQNLLQEIFSV